MSLRDLFGVEKKLKEQQPSQFHRYNQNMGFVERRDQNMAKYWLASEWKNDGGPRFFEW